MPFKETGEVGFDDEGFATHKPCGERLVVHWSVTSIEDHYLRRDGTTMFVEDDCDSRECDGVWCDACDVEVEGRMEE